MKLKNYSFLLTLTIFSLLIMSCGNNDPNSKTDTTLDEITFKEQGNYTEDKLKKDNTKVVKNIAVYTYIVEPEDVPVPVVKAEKIENSKNAKAVKRSNRDSDVPEKIEPLPLEMEVEYNKEEEPQFEVDLDAILDNLTFNRPPLFTKDCLSAERPNQCSNNAIENYMEENLDYPERSTEYIDAGLEHVVFRVTKEGLVENIKVRPKDKPCMECARAARKVVASTSGQWLPALRNGKAVNTKVRLLVQFKIGQ